MRFTILIAASAILSGASGAAPAAYYRGHVYHSDAYGAYASAYRYRNLNRCRIDPREETYIRVQDRFYQQSLGKAC